MDILGFKDVWAMGLINAAREVESFGKNKPLGRAGQPAELTLAYVLLASDEASYMTGALLPVTGGRPML